MAEIDLSPEVAGRLPPVPRPRHRPRAVATAALLVGTGYDRPAGAGGPLNLTGMTVVGGDGAVTVHWDLSNVGTGAARVDSVLVNDQAVRTGTAKIPGRSARDFATRLPCAPKSPRFRLTVTDGAGVRRQSEFLVDPSVWQGFCR